MAGPICRSVDIWHFMRRFASACTTESNQHYPFFLRQLSACIISWSAEDVSRLREAKRNQLVTQKISKPSNEDKTRSMSKNALVNYCRRTTYGVEETTRLIKDLITSLDGEQRDPATARDPPMARQTLVTRDPSTAKDPPMTGDPPMAKD